MARSTRGLILELKADTVVLLTQEGIFLELPRAEVAAEVSIGATIPLQLGDEWFTPAAGAAPHGAGNGSGEPVPAAPAPAAGRPAPRGLRWWRHARNLWPPAGGGAWAGPAGRRALAAAASVVVLLGLGLGLYRLNVVTAYEVAVEINPGVILEVNTLDSVVRARATNADGETILAAVNLRGLPVAEALTAVVRAARDLGFLPPAAAVNAVTAPLSLARGPEGPATAADDPGTGGAGTGGPEDATQAPPAASPAVDGDGNGDGEVDAGPPTVAVSVISRSPGAADDAGTRVADSLAGTLRAAASETGTAFNAVVQVVTTQELAQARRGAGRDTSIAKAVLAAQARERGLDLSDDDIDRASVRDLASMIQEHPSAPDGERGRRRLNLFRAQPGSDQAGDEEAARPGRGRRHDDGDEDQRRGRDRGRDTPDDGGRAGPGRGQPRWDDDGDDRRGAIGTPGRRDDDDRRRGGSRDRDGDDDDRGRRGNGPGNDRGADRGRGTGDGDDEGGNARPGRGREGSRDGGDDDDDRGRRGRDGDRRPSEGDRSGRGGEGAPGQDRWERLLDWRSGLLRLLDEFRNRQD